MLNNLVSVIIPSYNYASFLPDALDSLIAQSHPTWEAIVVDDGSQDETAAVVRAYCARDSRIRYHYQPNAGLSAARNTGLSLANGKYIQLLDADDYIAPTKLERHLETLLAQPEAALVFGDTYNFWHGFSASERPPQQFHMTKEPRSGQGTELALHMAYDNIFLVGTPVFRKQLADAIGRYDETLFSLEDWHFWCRGVLLGARYVYDNRPGTEFYVRSHGNNMSGSRYKMWKYKIAARRSLIEQMQRQVRDKTPSALHLPQVLRKHQALLHEEQARFNLLYGSVGAGALNAIQCAVRGQKPLRIWYDSAYWLKERLLKRK